MKLKERIALWFAEREVRKQIIRWLEENLGRSLSKEENKVLKNLVTAIFGKSWQTTVFGWAATAVGVTSTVGWFTPEGKPNWGVIVMALLLAAFSRQAKDHDVTGGTVQQ